MAGRFLFWAVALLMTSLAVPRWVSADDGVWALPGSGDWSDAASWMGGIPDTAGDVATVNDPPTSSATIALSADLTIGAFDIATQGPINVTGVSTLTFDTGDLVESRILVGHGLGDVTIHADLALTDGQSTEIGLPSAFANLQLSGDLSGGGMIRKTGKGFLTLDGNNDAWTGPLLIQSGRVILTNGARLGSSVAGAADGTTIEAGGVLALDTVQSGDVGGELFTLAGGRIEISGTSQLGDQVRNFEGPIHVPAGQEGEVVSLGTHPYLTFSGGATGDSLYLRNGGSRHWTIDTNPINLTGTLTIQNVRQDGQHGNDITINVPVVADELIMPSRFSPTRPASNGGLSSGNVFLNADSHFTRIKIEDGVLAGSASVVSSDDPAVHIWDGDLAREIEGITQVHKWTPQRARVASQDGVDYTVHGGILTVTDASSASSARVRLEADNYTAVDLNSTSYFDIDLNNSRGLPMAGALFGRGTGHIHGDIHLGDVGSVIHPSRTDFYVHGDITGGSLTTFGQTLFVDSDASYGGPTIIGRGGERAKMVVRGSIANSPEIIVNAEGEFRANASGLHPSANIRLRGGEFIGREIGGTLPQISLESGRSGLQAWDDIQYTIGTLSRDDQATVRFDALGNFEFGEDDVHAPRIFFESSPTLDNDIFGGWAISEYQDETNDHQADFATYSNELGVIPLSPVGRVSLVVDGQPNDNVRINSTQTPLTSDVTINSLSFSASGSSEHVDLNGHTLTIRSGGVVSWPFSSLDVIENGTLTSGMNQLFVHEGMEISADITDGPAGAVDLVLDSRQKNVVISGANTYSGATVARGSSVTFTSAASLPAGTDLYVEAPSLNLDFTPAQPVEVGTLFLRQGGVIEGAPIEATRYELESGLIFTELHGDADLVKTTEGTVRAGGTTGLASMEHFTGAVFIHDGLITAELRYGGLGTGPINILGGVVEFDPRGNENAASVNDFVLDGGDLSVHSGELILDGIVDVLSDSALLTFDASFDAGRHIHQDPNVGNISVQGPLFLRDGVTLSKLGMGELKINHLLVGAGTAIDIDVMSVALSGRVVSNATDASLEILSTTTGDGFARIDASFEARQGESLSLLKDGDLFEVAVQGASKEIAGGGTIINDLVVADAASVRPGDSVGTLTAGGDLTLAPGAVLAWEMSDPTTEASPGVGWDFLDVVGQLVFAGAPDEPIVFKLTSLDGLGDVGPLDDFDRHSDYEWLVASAASLVGFDLAEVVVDSAAFFDLNAAPSSAVLSLENRGNELYAIYELIPTPEDGDANGDGAVDESDYLIWAANYNATIPLKPPAGPSDGDFNVDGTVDGIDYVIWSINFGAGTSATAAPEPGTWALLCVGMLASGLVRRRQS